MVSFDNPKLVIMVKELSYCGELVRKHDPDRFLVSLLMPPDNREGLWALYAFNHEIAKTREIVADTTIGLIRLQWWRDALAEVYAGNPPRQNEIMPALAKAIGQYELKREWFEELIYAREFDLENVLPASLEGLENYAAFTNAPLLRLALRITGQTEGEETLRQAAVGYGLTGILRAVPFHARQQRCYLPEDLMAAEKASLRALYDFRPEAGLGAVTRAVGGRALESLKPRPQSRLARAHRRAARLYMQQIRRAGFNVFSPRLALPPPFFHLRAVLYSL